MTSQARANEKSAFGPLYRLVLWSAHSGKARLRRQSLQYPSLIQLVSEVSRVACILLCNVIRMSVAFISSCSVSNSVGIVTLS